jgi:hypothetical protein
MPINARVESLEAARIAQREGRGKRAAIAIWSLPHATAVSSNLA